MTGFFSWLLGLDYVASIDRIEVGLSAPWAQQNFFWLLVALVSAVALALLFYRRWQGRGSRRVRTALGLVRGALLVLLVLTLAMPVLRLSLTSVRPPLLFVVFDGTESMEIEDSWSPPQRSALTQAVGAETNATASTLRSRMDLVRALVRQPDRNVLGELQQATGARLEAFVFDGQSTSRLRHLERGSSARELPLQQWADQLTTHGQVSALGTALDDIRKQPGASQLAGVILFSDFAHNSGPPPVGGDGYSPLRSVGVPLYTVGCGAVETVDLAVELQTDPRLKKAERTNLVVKVRQAGLTGQTTELRVVGRRLGGDGATLAADRVLGEVTVMLNEPVQTIDLPFTPEESGLIEFVASVEPVADETIAENNRVTRQINVIDDFLRLMYVAYEPEWEWRFVKEVFHRDKLVGLEGFRTFLASSDPRVRQTNVLFLETLTPARSEFFANDVLFLGDMPGSAISSRFAEMVREFVSNLGGGLVVMAGPRFGPGEWVDTPLADMLPVILSRSATLRDEQSFRPRRTPHANLYPFMRLGRDSAENDKAWDNLGPLPWYQPVAALHEQAIVLAEHPTDTCADGKTPQPLVAIRQFGKGEVVYLGFNEIWRLRRKYGEQYYRQFWSQLIYRLGMSHALGSSKRFVPRVDRTMYRVEDEVVLTVDAFDENYEPLDETSSAAQGLAAELVMPAEDGGTPITTPLTIPLVRKGFFEWRFPVYTAGEYTVRIRDPISERFEERRFEVTDTSVERRRVVRDLRMQQELAQESGGRSYELADVRQLVRDVRAEPVIESTTRNHPLWTTPLWFGLVVALMISEWLSRKLLQMQ